MHRTNSVGGGRSSFPSFPLGLERAPLGAQLLLLLYFLQLVRIAWLKATKTQVWLSWNEAGWRMTHN